MADHLMDYMEEFETLEEDGDVDSGDPEQAIIRSAMSDYLSALEALAENPDEPAAELIRIQDAIQALQDSENRLLSPNRDKPGVACPHCAHLNEPHLSHCGACSARLPFASDQSGATLNVAEQAAEPEEITTVEFAKLREVVDRWLRDEVADSFIVQTISSLGRVLLRQERELTNFRDGNPDTASKEELAQAHDLLVASQELLQQIGVSVSEQESSTVTQLMDEYRVLSNQLAAISSRANKI